MKMQMQQIRGPHRLISLPHTSQRATQPILLKRSRVTFDGQEVFSYRKILLAKTTAGEHIQKVYVLAGFLFSTIRLK